MRQDKLTEGKTVATFLYEQQIDIVRQYAEYSGLTNFSAALRMIINTFGREHNFRNGDDGDKQQETAA